MRNVRILGAALLSLWLCGCGARPAGDASVGAVGSTDISAPSAETTVHNPGPPMVFPMKSFGGMTEVAQGATPSSKELPFTVSYPSQAGQPMGVFVSNDSAYPPGEKEVVVEYDDSSPYGAFRVREELMPKGLVDESFIEGIPSICDTCTEAKLVTLGPGITGAVLAGPDGPTSVTWLQGDYKLIVIGPEQTFSPDLAVKLADQVAANFNP